MSGLVAGERSGSPRTVVDVVQLLARSSASMREARRHAWVIDRCSCGRRPRRSSGITMADGVYLILEAKETKVLTQAGVRTAERPKERKGCVIFRAARHRGDENARTRGPHRCPRPYLYWVCAGEGQRQTSRVRPRDTHPRRKSAPDHRDHSVPGLPLEHVPLRRPERWLWQRNSRRRLPG